MKKARPTARSIDRDSKKSACGAHLCAASVTRVTPDAALLPDRAELLGSALIPCKPPEPQSIHKVAVRSMGPWRDANFHPSYTARATLRAFDGAAERTCRTGVIRGRSARSGKARTGARYTSKRIVTHATPGHVRTMSIISGYHQVR